MDSLIEKLIKTTAKMREKQRNYYRTRSHYILMECMKLEQMVDHYLVEIKKREGKQLDINL
jgi:hypothetical protein